MTEVVVVSGILGFVLIAVGTFSVGIFRYNRVLFNQVDAESQARRFINQLTAQLRTASPSSLGAYPIESATATSLTFFANIDADAYHERLRYFLNGTTLMRGVTKPSGSPLTYNPATEQVVSLITNVRNVDVFTYYDASYDGTSAPLTFPVSNVDIRLVRLRLSVDEDANTTPGPFNVETNVHIRNLKAL